MVGPYLKPAPSKWDDADKWLVSQLKSKRGVMKKTASHCVGNPTKKGHVGWQSSTQMAKNIQQVTTSMTCISTGTQKWQTHENDSNADSSQQICPDLSSNNLGEQTKRMDTLKCTNATDGCAYTFAFMPAGMGTSSKPRLSVSFDCYPVCDEQEDMKEVTVAHERKEQETYMDPFLRTENSPADLVMSVNANDPPLSPHETASYITAPPALRPVSMRDMGTEMTPMASQEPSRTGTPIRATTPTMRSPVSSHPSTPRRLGLSPSPQSQALPDTQMDDAKVTGLSEKEKTRREILALGSQLGKTSISAWASKEEEDADASKSLKILDIEDVKKNVLDTRAASWEEAEQAKHLARYQREEARIQAWENHEKAKAEAELQVIEVKVEKMRARAHEKLMAKFAVARWRAEKRRVAAEAKLNEQSAKTSQRAHHIRRTGRIPSSFFYCGFCH